MELNFLEPCNINLDEWNNIYTQFVKIMDDPHKFQDVLHGKVMATLFLSLAQGQCYPFKWQCSD